jgi:hypothetical protein
MAHRLTRLAPAALCAFLATWLVAPPLVAARPPVRQAATDTIVGTLHTIDVTRGSLRVTTGVGLALRVVELRLTADTRASAGGAPFELAALRPGDVVRVTSGTPALGHVAYTIERLSAAPGGAP